MNIVIKNPQEEHAEAIADICSRGWRQTVEGLLSETYQAENIEFWYNIERVKKDIKKHSYTHIALLDSKVVGVIGGGITKPGVGEIYVLYVSEHLRYKGIGRKLLDALTKQQIEQGVIKQWVSVQEENQKGIPFYEARGYVYQEKKINITQTGEKQVSLRYSRDVSE